MKTTPAFNNPVLAKIAELGKKLKAATERYQELEKQEEELSDKESELDYDADEAKDKFIGALDYMTRQVKADLSDAEDSFSAWHQYQLKHEEATAAWKKAFSDRNEAFEQKQELTEEILTLCLDIANA